MSLFSLQSNGTERFIVLNRDMKLSVLWKFLDGTRKHLMVFTTKVFWPGGLNCEHHSLETESSREEHL